MTKMLKVILMIISALGLWFILSQLLQGFSDMVIFIVFTLAFTVWGFLWSKMW